MNKVLLIGRVGKTPEVKTHESGSKTTKFSLATYEGYGDKKETTWHNITIWGDYGAKMAEYINVGSQIGIEGKMYYGAYEKDGVKLVSNSVIVDKVELLDKKSNPNDDKSDATPTRITSSQRTTEVSQTTPSGGNDDLPF